MGRDFIHYNRRDIRLRFPADPDDPWFAEYQGSGDGFDRPRYHVTRAATGPAAEIDRGDTIWLVGQLYAPWGERLPPTLDARIDVAAVRPRGDGFRYTAGPGSAWFALAGAADHLLALETRAAGAVRAALWPDPARPIGQRLRRIRRLANGELLRAWEAEVELRPLHFVSYRIRDGSRAAFACVKQLVEDGLRVAWDRWSLPRRLAERREAVGDAPLDSTLRRLIRDADVVWGIESRLYGAAGSYAARERDLARSLNKYRPFVARR